MRGIALKDIATFGEVNHALEAAGFQVMEGMDRAIQEGPSTPWYQPMESRHGTVGNALRRLPWGRKAVITGSKLAEVLRLFPKGSAEVIRLLDRTAEAYIAGGKAGIFTPLYCFFGAQASLGPPGAPSRGTLKSGASRNRHPYMMRPHRLPPNRKSNPHFPSRPSDQDRTAGNTGGTSLWGHLPDTAWEVDRYCFLSQIATSCRTSRFCCNIKMRFISLWRSFIGRNPRPEMNRRGLRISRSLADQYKIDEGAVNRCRKYPQSRIHINSLSRGFRRRSSPGHRRG